MKKYPNLLFVMLILAGLSGCGGGDDCGGYTSAGCGSAGSAESIRISYPITSGITNNENGTYRRKGSAVVSDARGQPVAKGTTISLQAVDSILAQGTLGVGGDTATGTTLTLPNVQDSAGAAIADLTTHTITRSGASGGSNRGILANDLVLLTSNGDSTDIVRRVASDPTLANSLTVNSAYNNNYPTYGNATYLVAISALGVQIDGEDSNANLVPGVATVTGDDGVATFWITYPSDVNHIMTGCNPTVDTRWTPANSGDVYVIAESGNAVIVDNGACFSPVAGFTLTSSPTAGTASAAAFPDDAVVSVCVRDGEDTVPVPFYPVSAALTSTAGGGTAAGTIALGAATTDASGCVTVTMTITAGAAADTATYSVSIGDASIDIVVTVTA